jgi:5-methylcytosine-specific restriction endonuclease McrA
MAHRGEAQRLLGLTQAQKDALDLGRQKGTNHLEGIPKSETSKQKRSEAMKKWAVNNPDKVKARGEKTKRENHYNWKGGARLFSHLVRDQAGKKWSNAVKERDKVCVHCGGSHRLESHHIIPLSVLVKQYGITTIEEARQYADILWNIDNGIALCRICHYKAHGKKYNSK